MRVWRLTAALAATTCLAALPSNGPVIGFSSNIGTEESVCPDGCSLRSESPAPDSRSPQPSPVELRRRAEEQPRAFEEHAEAARRTRACWHNEIARLMKTRQYLAARLKFRAYRRIKFRARLLCQHK
jgi:hypothetical protein